MQSVLKGKKIVLGVTGGIAAYKAADITSKLRKQGALVKVIMTKNALNFITPLTMETLSGNPVYYDTFEHRLNSWEIDHISLAKWADMMLIAPATANIISKVCHGIADDILSTTITATSAKVIFAPAMNTQMYRNPILQDNINSLKSRGYGFISPATGMLACGDWGEGKLADIAGILDEVNHFFVQSHDLTGITVLITAGPTREYIDPVRYISNPSSGKMGFSVAKVCAARGAEVHLVTGPTSLLPPSGVNVYRVETAMEMYDKVLELFPKCKLVFKTAAVGDYRPAIYSGQKIKKSDNDMTITLVRNPDILKELGAKKTHQILIGFAAETQNIEEYAKGKMKEKNLDFIFSNDVSKKDSGFQSDTNQGILFTSTGEQIEISKVSKAELAEILVSEIIKRVFQNGER